MARGLAHLAGLGDDRVQLYVEGDEERVVRMYTNAGFEIVQTDPAYRRECLPKGHQKLARACIHLKNDGSYELHEHTNIHDLSVFQAFLRIAYWEIAAGLREPPVERD